MGLAGALGGLAGRLKCELEELFRRLEGWAASRANLAKAFLLAMNFPLAVSYEVVETVLASQKRLIGASSGLGPLAASPRALVP